jgi:hypothetical protein
MKPLKLILTAFIVVCVATAAIQADTLLRRLPAQGDEGWDDRFGAPGFNGRVNAVAVSGSDVYVGGSFTINDATNVLRIAKWDGSSWSALGTGLNDEVFAIAASPNGDIYVGGAFTLAGGNSALRIAKWDGSSWSALGTGPANTVRAIDVDGTDVYAGGDFTAVGGIGALRVAKWDGSTWSALGTGLSDIVYAVAAYDGDVIVGGPFTSAGGNAALYIAAWNGSSWLTVSNSVSAPVYALEVIGGELYVGGEFTSAGGSAAFRIARWDGSSWSTLGVGVNNTVRAIGFDGTYLYAGGLFTQAGGSSAFRIAAWDGVEWHKLGSGLNDNVLAIDGGGSDLYVGGAFNLAGGISSMFFGGYDLSMVAITITGFEAVTDVMGVRLSWDIFADEEINHFEIYRREAGATEYATINREAPLPPQTRTYLDRTARAGESYQYMLGAVRPDGSHVNSNWIESRMPVQSLSLEQNYPNPFNPTTAIRFVLPEAAQVTLTVFDPAGRKVVTLKDETMTYGAHEVRWDGRDDAGNAVAAGVYFYRLTAGNKTSTKKMVLLK